MAYEPTNWKSGDVVTSAKLNKMESGIVAATPYIVNMIWNEDSEKFSLDKTANEIMEALKTTIVIVLDVGEEYACAYLMINGWLDSESNGFAVYDQGSSGTIAFAAATPNDYPVQTS